MWQTQAFVPNAISHYPACAVTLAEEKSFVPVGVNPRRLQTAQVLLSLPSAVCQGLPLRNDCKGPLPGCPRNTLRQAVIRPNQGELQTLSPGPGFSSGFPNLPANSNQVNYSLYQIFVKTLFTPIIAFAPPFPIIFSRDAGVAGRVKISHNSSKFRRAACQQAS